jgi:hypothetical protein
MNEIHSDGIICHLLLLLFQIMHDEGTELTANSKYAKPVSTKEEEKGG